MQTTYRALALLLLLVTTARTGVAADDYKLGPDSERQEGVPVGKVTNHTWEESKVYPGTKRSYSVYVPQQYDGSTAATTANMAARCCLILSAGCFVMHRALWLRQETK